LRPDAVVRRLVRAAALPATAPAPAPAAAPPAAAAAVSAARAAAALATLVLAAAVGAERTRDGVRVEERRAAREPAALDAAVPERSGRRRAAAPTAIRRHLQRLLAAVERLVRCKAAASAARFEAEPRFRFLRLGRR
jgi:hypothetical protein